MRRACLLLLSSFLCTAVAAQAIAAPASATLRWRGDFTTAHSLADGLAKAWARDEGGRLDVDSFNTISGIDQALDGRVDIAGSARPPFSGRPQESGLVFTPLAWDALVLITHRDNPVHNITLQQLYQVYMGYTTNWSQLGGPDKPINLYSIASPLDGVEFDLRKFLYGRGDQEIAAPRLYLNTQQLQVAVGLDPDALGVSAYSNVYRNPRLQMLRVEGIKPDARSISDGTYPMLVPLYFGSNPNDPKAAEVRRFMRFAEGPRGQAVIRAQGMIPYADGAALAAGADTRATWIAQRLAAEQSAGKIAMNGPLAAPGATYSQGASIAPTSPSTQAARARMQARDALDRKVKPVLRTADASEGGGGE
ncbi:MAG: substrate-binding domain-containing protein [Metallibacterium scheffleri]|jgi:phosphate transport system substrate-binding protein